MQRQAAFAFGEQAAGEIRSPGQGLLEAGHVHDVDADADDHAIAWRTTSASSPATSSASTGSRAPTLTRMSGSGPPGRRSTPPPSPSRDSAPRPAAAPTPPATAP